MIEDHLPQQKRKVGQRQCDRQQRKPKQCFTCKSTCCKGVSNRKYCKQYNGQLTPSKNINNINDNSNNNSNNNSNSNSSSNNNNSNYNNTSSNTHCITTSTLTKKRRYDDSNNNTTCNITSSSSTSSCSSSTSLSFSSSTTAKSNNSTETCCCGSLSCTGDVSKSEHYCLTTKKRCFAWCFSPGTEIGEGHGSTGICKGCSQST